MKSELINNSGRILTSAQASDMQDVVALQMTSDREWLGTECIMSTENGTFHYYIDEDNDVILTEVR